MKTNNEGLNRRNIPVKFMDYIAQKHGYGAFANVKKKSHYARISAEIKKRFSQTTVKVRRPYEHTQELTRRPKETALQFAIRVDSFNDFTSVQEYNVTFTPGTVPGDIMISGDAETLGLSDLKPETIKQVAAELLGQEIEKTEALRKIRNFIEDDALKAFAQHFGKMMSRRPFPKADYVPDYDQYEKIFEYKHPEGIPNRMEVVHDPFPRKRYFAGNVEVFPETGSELISDKADNHRQTPDLKIETNQQWSPEELKKWLAKPEQQNRKAYVFREDRKSVTSATSNDGITWRDDIVPKYDTPADTDEFRQAQKRISHYGRVPVTEIKIRNYTLDNWPKTAPPYFSTEGWEFEKAMKLRQLKSMLTIEWLEKQQTEKHALVAQRLREILAA